MAVIIDFTQMREVLGSRPGRTARPLGDLPLGEVVLFTGVRYERYETDFEDDPLSEASNGERRAKRKKKS